MKMDRDMTKVTTRGTDASTFAALWDLQRKSEGLLLFLFLRNCFLKKWIQLDLLAWPVVPAEAPFETSLSTINKMS